MNDYMQPDIILFCFVFSIEILYIVERNVPLH